MILAWLAARMWPLIAVAVLLAGGVWYHHHAYHQGELAADARHAVIEAANSARADRERAALNARIAVAQALLDAARVTLATLQKDYDHEKAISNQRQLDLLAGRERLRILARVRPACPNGSLGGPAVAGVDPGTSVEVDIDGRSAAWIDGLRADHNAAVKRLDACIVAYDAVKAAADAMP